jgi:hypothetical protein
MELSVEIHSDRRWSYANAGTRRPVVRKVILHQNGYLPVRDINIVPRVSLDFPTPEPVCNSWSASVPKTIEARGGNVGESITWERVDLKFNYPLLGRIQEKVRGQIRVEIVDIENDEVLAVGTQDLDLLAPNEFRQESDYIETIAAFVLPTDPFVAEILVKARQLLKDRTGNSATEGYQADQHDPKQPYAGVESSRAFEIAHAVYDAMSSIGYDYSNPPGYFDSGNQRVRTPSQIKQENCATCLDSTVLMAACLAQSGLEPVIFLTNNHAFTGYFSGKPFVDGAGRPRSGSDAVNYLMTMVHRSTSQAQLLRNRDYGLMQELLRNQHIIPIETTTTTRSTPKDFISACQRQNGFSIEDDPLNGTDDSGLDGIVVVRLARLAGIMPPVVLNSAVAAVSAASDELLVKPLEEVETGEDDLVLGDDSGLLPEERAIPPRIRQWMASLLDLTARNPLLKVKPAQMMEFDLPSGILGEIDDMLFTPKKRIKLPAFGTLPSTWVHNGVTDDQFEKWSGAEMSLVYPSYKEVNSIHDKVEAIVTRIKSDPSHPNHEASEADLIKGFRERLLLDLDAKLNKTAKGLIDKSQDVMLATGNGGMFLALGTIAWEETASARGKKTKSSFCAPLFLYPVILEGGKGRPWTIRLDSSGEVTPNYCLHEKLRRSHNLDLKELINPTEDEKGIDIDLMIRTIKKRLSQAKMDNFAVQPRAILGVFDYATFRLWKDLRDDWKRMSEISPVFKHLAYTANTTYTGNPSVPAPRLEPLLPIAADDSQRNAIQMALDGQSFRLEGPPGTGKSQTITNLLASCIAHNLKVLFVAEKQTALNAVKDRLDKTGLGKFSLNLHAKGDSDTKLRKNISEALTDVMRQQIDPADQKWDEISSRLKNEEYLLNRYRESLHEVRADGFSTWVANEQLLEVGEGSLLELPPGFVHEFKTLWPQVREAVFALDGALDLVPAPDRHPWRFLESLDLASLDLADLTTALSSLASVASELLALDPETAPLVGSRELGLLRDAMSLHEKGALNDLGALEFRAKGTHSGDDAYRRAVEEFLIVAGSLHDKVAPHVLNVSPSVIEQEGFEHLRAIIEKPNSVELITSIQNVEEEWAAMALAASSLPAPAQFVLLSASEMVDAKRMLEAIESPDENREFDEIVSRLRALQAEVRQHETNISPDFLSRNDIPNITFLLRQFKEAGALSRRSKLRTLREAIGAQALTADDRLLTNSLETMISRATDAQNLVLRLQDRFSEVLSPGFRPWAADDINALASALSRTRISRLREKNYVSPAPDDDRTYVLALRQILELVPLAESAIKNATKLLPIGSPPFAFKPWVPGEFALLRDVLDAAHLQSVREALGGYALTADVRLAADSALVLCDLAPQIRSLNSALRTSLIPGFSREFRVWDARDINMVDVLANDLVSLVARLAPIDIQILRSAYGNPNSHEVGAKWLAVSEAWESLGRIFGRQSIEAWLDERDFLATLVQELPRLINDAGQNNNYIELNRWQTLRSAVDRMNALGLSRTLDPVLSGQSDTSKLLDDIRRSALTQALRLRMEEGNLDRFDRKIHERRIKSFEDAMNEARKVLVQRIPGLAVRRLRERQLPSGAQRGATQDLQRGLQPKRGEKVPIRDLIKSYGDALADHMPCFLMSPDSVAALVPVGSIDFDLVVFDEASQVRTAHAVGALGRGRAGIVVGDSRQMPPSSAFASNLSVHIVDDEFDDEVDDLGEADGEGILAPMAARDAESILTEFYESEMPALQLLCHYRSKDELLISFSNSYIYDEPMLTFPSSKGLDSKSLRYVYVPDGHFERDKSAEPHIFGNGAIELPALRTNLREAQEISEEVLRRLRDPKRIARRAADPEKEAETLIVVTFNVPQMKLIREMLRASDPELIEMALTGTTAEDDSEKNFEPQLKIRNVENVQGDEAETIIFSVAFSRQSDGKIPMRFGPVTNTGGDRRLNVAVTRAKREMIVYASFLPDELGQGRTSMSHEATMLQQFLRLAHHGATSTGDIGIAVPRSRHIESIAQSLREIGFEVHTQLGLSTLRVDIALRRPGSSDWEFAIMVDDTCWADRGTAYQREVLPRQMLPSMGWKSVYRIWLPAWKNSRAEILADMKALFESTDDVASEEPVVVDELSEASDPAQSSGFIADELPPASSAVTEATVNPVQSSLGGGGFETFTPYEGKGRGGQSTVYDWPTDPAARQRLLEVIDAVLAAEAPIEVERFGKMVYRAFDFGRVNADRIEQVLSLVQKGQVKKDVVGRFVWRTPGEWETWTRYRTASAPAPRTVEEIPAVEWANALLDFVRRSRSMRHDDALKELGLAFGFLRVSAQMRSLIEKAMKEAVKAGRLVLEDGAYRLP